MLAIKLININRKNHEEEKTLEQVASDMEFVQAKEKCDEQAKNNQNKNLKM